MKNKHIRLINLSSAVVGLFLLIILLIPQVAVATVNEDIPIDAEYDSGIITQQDETMKISNAWVNSNHSEFLSIALFDGELDIHQTTTTTTPTTTTTIGLTSINISVVFFGILLVAIPFSRKRRK